MRKQYAPHVYPLVTKHGGNTIAMAKNIRVMESSLPEGKLVIVEFPSRENVEALSLLTHKLHFCIKAGGIYALWHHKARTANQHRLFSVVDIPGCYSKAVITQDHTPSRLLPIPSPLNHGVCLSHSADVAWEQIQKNRE